MNNKMMINKLYLWSKERMNRAGSAKSNSDLYLTLTKDSQRNNMSVLLS
jgi:hypothetical protein